MKRMIRAVLLSAMVFTACGAKEPNTTTDTFNYKTGLATYTHTNDTYGYTEGKNGQSAVSTTIVAAVFDDNGKIIDIKIDEVESKVRFDNTGRLSGYTGSEVLSKKELKDDYGMKAASSIGKEWYQQIDTLEKWLVGKDVNTVISSAKGRIGSMMDGMPEYGKGYADGYNNSYGSYDSNNYDGYGMEGRTGANSDSVTSGSVTSDAENMVEEFADGVGDVVDGIMGDGTTGNGAADNGTAYNNGTADTSWMDADLKAGVTIDVTYIQKAIEKAYRNRA